MPGGEELQAPCLAASEEDLLGHLPDLTRDPPRAGNHLDPLMEAWLKRGVHSPVASLSSFVDYRETMDWVQEMITDLACFKLAPVTTVYAVSRPVPPPNPLLPPFPRSAVETTDSKCDTGRFFPKPGSPLSAPLHLANSSLTFRILNQESFGHSS